MVEEKENQRGAFKVKYADLDIWKSYSMRTLELNQNPDNSYSWLMCIYL